jgi:hypothetical protein
MPSLARPPSPASFRARACGVERRRRRRSGRYAGRRSTHDDAPALDAGDDDARAGDAAMRTIDDRRTRARRRARVDATRRRGARGGDGARAGVFERDDDDDDDDGWCAREATDGARARENFGRRSR